MQLDLDVDKHKLITGLLLKYVIICGEARYQGPHGMFVSNVIAKVMCDGLSYELKSHKYCHVSITLKMCI